MPAGTSLARSLLETTILKGAMAKILAIPLFSWLSVWPLRPFLEKILETVLVDPTLDEAVSLAIALKYVVDRQAFDQEFIKNKMLDKTAMTSEQREASLVAQQKVVYKFIRRGPVT